MTVKFVYSPPPLLNTSDRQDDPGVERSAGCQVFHWKGHPYLVSNLGNQLGLYDIADPAHARLIGKTTFSYHPFGDRDENLFNFAISDDARFAMCGFDAMGAEVLDFGTGDVPSLRQHHYYPHATGYGGFAFEWEGQHYLVMHAPGGGNCGLYAVNGLTDMHLLQPILDQAGHAVTVVGGWYLPGPTAYVYLIGGSWVYPYRITAAGLTLVLTPLPRAIRGTWCQSRGVEVDVDARVAVGTSPYGVELWSLLDPGAPTLWKRWKPFGAQNAVSAVGLRYPHLWCSVAFATSIVKTFDIADLSNPVEVSPETWAAGQPCQSYRYMADCNAAFVEGWMWRSSWSVLERFKVKDDD